MQSGKRCLPRKSTWAAVLLRGWGGGESGAKHVAPRVSLVRQGTCAFLGRLDSQRLAVVLRGREGRRAAGQGADSGRLLQGGTERGKSPRRPRPASYPSWGTVILLVVGREARLLGVPSAAEGRGTSRPLPAGRLHTPPVLTADASRCHHVPPWSKTDSTGKPEAGGRSWPPAPRGPCVGGAGAGRGAEMFDLQLQGQTSLLSLGLSKSQRRVHVSECA